MPNKLLYICQIGLQCLRYSYFVQKLDLEFKMCLLTSATGSSGGPGKVVEADTFIKMLTNCCLMSQKKIKTLISKMPEIFDQNHDWIGVLLSKEPK